MKGESSSLASEAFDVLSVRLSDEVRAAVEAWARKQPDKPSVPEALRRLIEHGLATD